VTGGCGFLGSHVCELFLERGWEAVAFDNMTKFELSRTGYATDAARDHNSKILAGLGATVLEGDVRDLDELLDAASGCDYIVHTAAQPAVTISVEDPLYDLSSNVVGTVHALEAARRHGLPVASCATIHVYGNLINDTLTEGETRYLRDPAEIDERAPTMEGALSPLHASKASADHYVTTYASAYGVRAASFRLTGLYGPRQLGGEDHGWVANFVIRNLLGWPITIFGTGKQVRDILYASDAAEAFLAFFESGQAGVYNVGGGARHAISLLESLEIIQDYSGQPNDVRFEPGRYGDLLYFVCDTARARESMGWQAAVAPPEGIAGLVDWVRDNLELFRAPEQR